MLAGVAMLRVLVAAILMSVSGGPQTNQAGESPGIAAGARLEKQAGGFRFTEGPAADVAGNVYFTDQPNDRILLGAELVSVRYGIYELNGDTLKISMNPVGRSKDFEDKLGPVLTCLRVKK